jgi:TetR/AcrR family transcriptional repressor of nem operon
MAKAGLTHGGFYAHFKSKDELIAEAISTMFEERYAFFLSCVEGQDPARGLATFIDAYLSLRHRDAARSGCPIPSLSSDVARLPLAARKRFTAGIERHTEVLAGLLREMHHSKPEQLAASVLAEMVGALTLSRVTDNPELANQTLKSSRNEIKRRLGLADGPK